MAVNHEDILGRLLFFDRERKDAEELYVLNPRDVDNLIRWAGALFELSEAKTIIDAREMKKDVISKLEEALSLNPENHFVLWGLGNAYKSHGRLYPIGGDTFNMSFDKACAFFKKALDKDPENKVYLKSKEKLEQNFKKMTDNNNKAAKKPKKASNLPISEAMDVDKGEILDRLLFFERERKYAEALYVLNPRDADNLTRWAGALFELSRAQDNTNAREMRKDAISILEKALSINSENHYILWCLGNTYSSLAKTYPVGDTSRMYFDRAYGYFKKSLDKDPENKLYLTSKQKFLLNFGHYFIEMSDNNKAPEPHMETLKNGLGLVGESSGSSNPKKKENIGSNPREALKKPVASPLTIIEKKAVERQAAKKWKSSNLMYNKFGLVILAVGIFAWIQIAKSRVPPPPPR